MSKRIVRPLPPQWAGNITQHWGKGAWGPNGEGGHPGTDYGCPAGTPIYSIADGVVIYAGYASGFGFHAVCIWHPELGVSTTYGHAQAHYVNFGDQVVCGQHIADADNQGYSLGSHLHFEVRPIYSAFGGNPPNVDSDAFLVYCITLQNQPIPVLTAADRVLISTLQKILYVPTSGQWFTQTDDAFKKLRHNTIIPPNKSVDNPQVYAIQSQVFKFSVKDRDGKWGPKTEAAYNLVRYCWLYK